MKLVSFLYTLLVSVALAAVPTLDLSFDKPKVIDVGGEKIEITGPFTQDGYLLFGRKGVAIPAKTLVSNVGTIIIDCRWQPMKSELGRARSFVSLRNKGYLSASIYSLNTEPLHAFFQCYDQDKQNYNPTLPIDIVDGTAYQMGFSYDGNTIRVFLNGKQIAEAPQMAQFDAPSYIYIGPYIDHIYNPPAWDDDCEIKRLRVYNEPLSVLGDFFCDIPSKENSTNAPWVRPSVDDVHRGGGRSIPYLLSRNLSEEYPEIAAYGNVWRVIPGAPLDYTRDGTKYIMPECCPTTGFSAFHAWKIYEYIKRIPTDGIYLDCSICGFCGNKLHGCNQRIPLLAQREFYRRVIFVQLMAGIKEPVLVLHNTDSIQLPAFTFCTHLFNGEQLRQDSSTIMHNGKDILDTYDTTMFASELSSLPFGITNSVYQANDILTPRYGGEPNENPELYKFRITKPMLAGALVHNTMPSLSRCHFCLFDCVVRVYDAFDVPNAEFIGYWKAPAQISGGKDIFVSVYKHHDGGKCLAVISHIGKDHDTQTLDIAFDLGKLGMKKIASAKEFMGADDPEYAELFQLLDKTRIDGGKHHQLIRTPLKWGDAGVKLLGFKENHVSLELKFHSFALIEITE